jgi:hypothetical protein
VIHAVRIKGAEENGKSGPKKEGRSGRSDGLPETNDAPAGAGEGIPETPIKKSPPSVPATAQLLYGLLYPGCDTADFMGRYRANCKADSLLQRQGVYLELFKCVCSGLWI